MVEGFTIQEASERTGLTTHTLRYYERAGLLTVNRQGGGHRRFSELDLGLVDFITKLRATGMPIRSVRRYVELVSLGDATKQTRMTMLVAHRADVLRQLEELARCLNVIDAKIAYYETGRWPEDKAPCPPHLRPEPKGKQL